MCGWTDRKASAGRYSLPPTSNCLTIQIGIIIIRNIQDEQIGEKMNAVLVGADRLGNIPDSLAGFGIQIRRHVTGRSSTHQRSMPTLPRDTDLLILFTDFLNHNAMKSYRNQAQVQGIPVIACKRSASCLMESVRRYLSPAGQCKDCPKFQSQNEK